MMDQYRTSGVLDEAAVKETAKIFVPSWYLWLTRIFCVFCFLLFLIYILVIVKKTIGSFCFLLFATVIFALYPTLLRHKYRRLTITRLTEQAGSPYIRIESFFNVDGLVVHNLDTDGSVLLRYDDIAFLAESKHYFALMTKGQQFTLSFKDCLTDEQKRRYRADLKQRCSKLKIRR